MIYIRYINENDLRFSSFNELFRFVNDESYKPSILDYLTSYGIPTSDSTFITNYEYYKNKLNIIEIVCSRMYLDELPFELYTFTNLLKINCK